MNRKVNRSLLSAVIAAAVFQTGVTASAAPLVLDNVTPRAAAAQLSGKYGVTVIVPAATAQRVSLTLDDADAPGMRLQAVSALANALRVDFTTTYIVGKADDGHGVPPTVDSSASIPFGKTMLSAREAIETLAGVNNATAEMAGDVGGTMTLSSATLTGPQAAQEIAAQTGTTWHLVYTLARRSPDPAHWGRVIGRTAGGSPIVEMPGLYFVDFQKQARQEREAAAIQQKADQEQAAQLQAQQQAAQQAQQQQLMARFQAALQSGFFGTGAGSGYNFPGAFSPNPGTVSVISGGDPTGGMGGYGGYGFGYGSNFIGNGY